MAKNVLAGLNTMCYNNSMYYDMVAYSGLRVLPDDRRKSDPCYIKRTPDSEWELFEGSEYKHEYKKAIATPQQLREDVMEYGVNKGAYKIIADKYGLNRETIHHKLNDMGYTEKWWKEQMKGSGD